MKIGLGLCPHLLSEENYRFAYQAGATHIVAHLPDSPAAKDAACRRNRCGPWTSSPGSNER